MSICMVTQRYFIDDELHRENTFPVDEDAIAVIGCPPITVSGISLEPSTVRVEYEFDPPLVPRGADG